MVKYIAPPPPPNSWGVPKRQKQNGGLVEPKRRNTRRNGHQNMAAEYASLAERWNVHINLLLNLYLTISIVIFN